MQKKVSLDVSKAKLLAQIAMGASNGDPKWERTVSSIWKEYLRAAYCLEAEHEDLEKDMQAEYKKFSHLRPKLVIQKDGSLKVTGIPKAVL